MNCALSLFMSCTVDCRSSIVFPAYSRRDLKAHREWHKSNRNGPPDILFPFSRKPPGFGCPCTSTIFSKNDGFSRHYPGSHGTSLTKPANRSLPFLHTGQLGCRKFRIHSSISFHTVSCFSQTRRPSSMSSSFLVSVSIASNCLAVSMFCLR